MTVPTQRERTAGPPPLRVLLVEDCATDARLITHRMRAVGRTVSVRVVDDRQGFLDGLREHVDVVLCDFSLPSFGAPEVLALLRDRHCEVPVIIVSGVLEDDVATRLLDEGAADFLLKDRLGRLPAAVEAALARTRLSREARATRERAEHDGLTGLLNREGMHERVRRLQDAGCPYALVLLDLDGFKAVNDTYGHAAGDDVLRQVGERLREAVRRGDAVARLGGDEFVVVLAGARDERRARSRGEEVRAACVGEVGDLALDASAGVALAGPDEQVADVLERADARMYAVKRRASGRADARHHRT